VELATGIELDGIGMATDGRLLYVSSDNRSSDNRVYRIGPGMNAVLFAGTGVQGYAGDRGPATAAQFDDPNGLAVGPDHALYVADGGNGRIRRIATDLTVSTVAGGGTGRPIDGDSATKPELAHPADVAFDGTGNLYILESGSQAIRKVTPDGRIWTIVPPHQPGFAGDGGSAKQARFGGNLEDFAVAPDGTIYVLDRGNSRLRRITPQGIISTVR
jgi:glucose/arabinose dehydrogenase